MKDKVNTYFAVLIIVIAGANAAWVIVRVATTDILTTAVIGSEASYAPLQKSILGQ